MPNPFIQIGDQIREMTDEEYQVLVESGWTEEETSAPDNSNV